MRQRSYSCPFCKTVHSSPQTLREHVKQAHHVIVTASGAKRVQKAPTKRAHEHRPLTEREKQRASRKQPTHRRHKKRPPLTADTSYAAFYQTREWRELRVHALVRYGRVCALCRTTEGEMHVDHIVPRSLNRSLELTFSNLQVLCKDCNIGKSNHYSEAWD